jgi:hypothetical protein
MHHRCKLHSCQGLLTTEALCQLRLWHLENAWMFIHSYVASRGMAAAEMIFQNLRGKAFCFPDLICDQVLDLAERILGADKISFYHVDRDFAVDWRTTHRCDVFYSIDYFGQEQNFGDARELPAPIVIRDAVWFPYPERPIKEGEIWFNSFRKFAWPANGSIMLSSVHLSDATTLGTMPVEDLPLAFKAASPQEQLTRRANYSAAAALLRPYVLGHATFPSVVPLAVPNRDMVVECLAAQGIKLPGMWKNKTGCRNDLYDTLMLLPCDSRFGAQEMQNRVGLVAKAIEAAKQEA